MHIMSIMCCTFQIYKGERSKQFVLLHSKEFIKKSDAELLFYKYNKGICKSSTKKIEYIVNFFSMISWNVYNEITKNKNQNSNEFDINYYKYQFGFSNDKILVSKIYINGDDNTKSLTVKYYNLKNNNRIKLVLMFNNKKSH